jgi:methylated-DNA-[protein]-cysteine S-methyltransferase
MEQQKTLDIRTDRNRLSELNDRASLMLSVGSVETPLGVLILATDSNGDLCAADFIDHEQRLLRLLERRFRRSGYTLSPGSAPAGIEKALAAYFMGDLDQLRTIRLRTGGTPFQQSIWAALRDIRAGTSMSYSGLAAQLGKPNAARAVGHANGSNPFNIIIPCHRLIGANGSLTGYAGGIARKRWLLDHEARYANTPFELT